MTDDEKQLKRLSLKRYALGIKYPFYGILLNGMELIIDNSMPSAYTNGKVVGFNTKFTESLSDLEVVFVLCHEVMHVVEQHILRTKSRFKEDANKYWKLMNMAQDYRINYDIKHQGIGEMPSCALYDSKYDESWTSDMIFDDLMKDADKHGGKDTLDSHDKWGEEAEGGGQGGGNPITSEELMSKVIGAVQAAESLTANSDSSTGCSSGVPSRIKRMVDEYLTPQINWKDEVSTVISDYRQNFKSWRNFDRRYAHKRVYLQAYSQGEKAVFCVAIDTSGSVSDKEASVALNEVRASVQELDDYELYVMNFSHHVHQCKRYDKHTPFDFELEGSGGTDLSCITTYLEDNDIYVDSLFVISDLGTYHWPCESYCEDTTFLATTKITAPYGRTLRLAV